MHPRRSCLGEARLAPFDAARPEWRPSYSVHLRRAAGRPSENPPPQLCSVRSTEGTRPNADALINPRSPCPRTGVNGYERIEAMPSAFKGSLFSAYPGISGGRRAYRISPQHTRAVCSRNPWIMKDEGRPARRHRCRHPGRDAADATGGSPSTASSSGRMAGGAPLRRRRAPRRPRWRPRTV